MSYLQNKMENVDFDYIMSKNTLSYIEAVCLDYKKKILKDLSENIDVSYSELSKRYLENYKKVKYHGKPRDQIDNTKCMARIWHKKLGPVQCSNCRPAIDTNDDDLKPMFCKIHMKKLNYGRIDLPFEDYGI